MAERRKVMSVGQCSMDHSTLGRYFAREFGADVLAMDTAREAMDGLRESVCDLVLVNRVLDADGSSGVELIRQIKSDRRLHGVPVMLVSNYPEAQSEAIAAGALNGFGKLEVGLPATRERLATALGD